MIGRSSDNPEWRCKRAKAPETWISRLGSRVVVGIVNTLTRPCAIALAFAQVV